MTHQSETATDEPMRVTVFEHHDANAASRDVAIVRTHRWQFLTKEEATGT
jgi:hypothetical protein